MMNWIKNLPDAMRKRFDDRQRFLLACVVCGLACGVLAVVFHLMIHHTFEELWKLANYWQGQKTEVWHFVLVMLAAPTLGGLICGLAIKYWVPGCFYSHHIQMPILALL